MEKFEFKIIEHPTIFLNNLNVNKKGGNSDYASMILLLLLLLLLYKQSDLHLEKVISPFTSNVKSDKYNSPFFLLPDIFCLFREKYFGCAFCLSLIDKNIQK